MIQYLLHTQIDKLQWDNLVQNAPQQQVYALSWYLDTVAPGWNAIVAVDPAGNYQLALPLPVRRRLGMQYVQQPLYCQQLGIFSRESAADSQLYAQMLDLLYQKHNYVVSLHFNTANFVQQALPLAAVPVPFLASATHYLSLSDDYAALYRNYSRDRKLNLKRAKQSGISIEQSKDIEPLIGFFKEEVAGRIYGGVAEEAYVVLRKLYRELEQRGLAKLLYTVGKDGKKNAGCLFIIHVKRIIYIFNAASEEGRRYNGRTLILDGLIRQYAGQDYVLDFESPGEEAHNIVRVYAGFGAVKTEYAVLKYNRLPKLIKYVREVRLQFVRKLRGMDSS